MPLPQNLTSYEFAREIIEGKEFPHYFYLKVVYESDLPKVIKAPVFTPETLSRLQFADLSAPLEIEIGCGKGNFMVEYCQAKPEVNYIAIDHDGSIAAYAASRVAKRESLKNTRVVFGDAYFLFRDFLPDNCTDVFHMYFPDPWPKKRHHKRRLLKQEYLEQVHRIAKPGALFHWGTDFQKYHLSALETFSEFPGIELLQDNAEPVQGIRTNFEKKYIQEGRPIYRSTFKIIK